MEGYLATQFENNAYHGIKNNQLDAYIESLGGLVSVGQVEDVLALMSKSENGIVNLSGSDVDKERMPPIFSPGYGQTQEVGGILLGITWQIIIGQGTNQQKIYELSVTMNAADSSNSTVASISLRSSLFAGSDTLTWTKFASGNSGVDGIKVDTINKTFSVLKSIDLTIASGSGEVLKIIGPSGSGKSTLIF